MVSAPTDWPVFSLQQLDSAIGQAKTANKYLFIWDKQGSVGTFMQYKGFPVSLGPEVVKMALGRQTAEEVGDFIRKGFINSMRTGDNMCLDMDVGEPDFCAYNKEGTFEAEKFFDHAWMTERDNYIHFVREDENHGIGGINPGNGYVRHRDYAGVFRSGAETGEEIMAILGKMPHQEDFLKVIIQ